MANVVLYPADPDGTVGLTALGGGNHWEEVDDWAGGGSEDDNGSYVHHTGNPTASDFLSIDATPADFDTSTDFTLRFRTTISGISDDTVECRIAVFESDESTQVGTEVSDGGGNHAYTTTTGSTDTAGDANAATWDTRLLRLQVFRSNSGMPDSIDARITAAEVSVNYDVLAQTDIEFASTQGGTAMMVPPALPEVVGY